MHNNSIAVIEDLCRTCMNEGIKRAISIFNKEENADGKTIMELLLLTAPHLSVDSDDMLPKNLCETCLERLMIAYNFQKMCVRVEKKLREMIKKETISMASQMDKDPLEDISVSKEVMLNSANDAAHILNVGRHSEFMDQIDTPLISSKSISLGTETVDSQWEEMNDSGHSDSGSEVPSTDAKIENVDKATKKIVNTTRNGNQNSEIADDTQNAEDIGKVIKTFECDKCGNRLSTQSSLNRHKRNHLKAAGVLNTKSENKSKGSGNVEEVKQVDDITKSEKQNSETTDSIQNSKILGKVKSEGFKNFECDECGNRLSTRTNLNRHKRNHLKAAELLKLNLLNIIKDNQSATPATVACDNGKQFVSEESPDLVNTSASKCDKGFEKNNDTKNEHQISEVTDTSENPKVIDHFKKDRYKKYECDECGNRLSTRTNLNRHKRNHLRPIGVLKSNSIKSKRFECDECGKRLSTKKGLIQHKLLIHARVVIEERKKGLNKKKFECEFCKKVFRRSSSLEVHVRKHTGEKPYLCTECGKTLKCWYSLQQHALRHRNEKSFVCPVCPKRFRCKTDLASHKIIHNKIKSHVCDICGAGFVNSDTLKKHKIYHGEKKHKCDYCDMRFFVADHCRRHMRTHTGEKPYKCKYCERAFAQSNDMMKHLRSHLGDNVYGCELCPQRFRLLGDLRVHFCAHKNDDEETKARNLQALRDEEHRLQVKLGLIRST